MTPVRIVMLLEGIGLRCHGPSLASPFRYQVAFEIRTAAGPSSAVQWVCIGGP